MTQRRRVMTEYGPGEVVASQTVRGRTEHKVEGPGFSIWVDAAQVPEFGQVEWEVTEDTRWDNSTTLPYNPEPQFPAQFYNDTSTIQPNQHVDSEERLSPADSVSFENRSRPSGPQPSPSLFTTSSLADVQARLGDKYIDIPVDVDRSSLQARLDEDPARVVSDVKMANFENRGELDPRVAQTMDLEYVDSELRTAAWADVRKKAIRLRTSGAIQLEAANPTAIVARVTGDHGIYDVAVIRGNALTGSSAITDWTCSCPWGDWAFEREKTFVGRLCSHAYAAYLELRSLAGKRRKEKPYGWSATAAKDDDEAPLDLGYEIGDAADDEDKTAAREVHALQVGDRVLTNYGDEATVVEYPEILGDREDPDYAVVRFDDGSEEALHATQELRPLPNTAARHPRPDGRLSTEPGTLEPELCYIPEGHSRDRVDVTVDDREDIARTSAIEDIRPNTWTPEVRDLLSRLKDLWAEGDRPQRAAERQQEIRDVVGKLRELGFDSSGVATAMRHAQIYDWDIEDFLREAFLSEPFEGSGPAPKESFGTSEDEVARQYLDPGLYRDDVDGPDANPAQPNADDVVVASNEGADDSRAWLLEGSAEPEGGQFDFAAAAQQYIQKTAGRTFTFAEQQALMNEQPADGEPLSPDELDLDGTHYLS